MSTPPNAVLHPGSTILVTGVNGLIGSYIADALLQRGYHVRGAVRDVQKSGWLREYFEGRYEAGLELVEVGDMSAEGCYDRVVGGTSGFIHVAAPLTGTDPHVTIPIGTRSTLNALRACAKTPSISRFVYTSSSIAASYPSNGVRKVLDRDSWNEVGVQQGWNHPEGMPEWTKGGFIYAALKTESERACWKWVEENNPSFAFNAVLPNANFSRVLVPSKQGAPSTIAWAKSAFTGENFENLSLYPPQWCIATRDTALLHVAALLHPDVDRERIFGYAHRWSFNNILAIYRKDFPERTFPEDPKDHADDMCEPPRERAEELLRWVKGEGWESFESMMKEMGDMFGKGEA